MLAAVKSLRYIMSTDGLAHTTVEDLFKSSGLLSVPWEARTWVLRMLGEMMLRMWYEAAKARVNDSRQWNSSPLNEATEKALRHIGGSKGKQN